MLKFPAFGRDTRVNALLGTGHFLSHYYQLCLPPVFIAWQKTFDVSFAELGLAMAVDVGRDRDPADADGVSRRPLRLAAVPGRRDRDNGAVGGGDVVCHVVLADRGIGIAVGLRQFGDPSGRLLDPQRFDRPGAARPLLRIPHLCRQYRLCRRTAGDRGADFAARLARRLVAGRAVGRAGGADDPVAEPDSDRSAPRAARTRVGRIVRHQDAAEPVGRSCSSPFS